jgi:Zn finger protein HypA/HybF involved in hydrogenase expression
MLMSDEKQKPEDHGDVSLYQKLADRTAEILAGGKKSLDEALKKASDELAAGGEYSREQAEKITAYLRRDLAEVGKKALQARDAVLEAVEPHRMVAGVQSGLAKLLKTSAELLSELAGKSEHVLEFKTGEVTSPGTLTCKDCGKEMHLKATGRIPPCPQCHKTMFRKSY